MYSQAIITSIGRLYIKLKTRERVMLFVIGGPKMNPGKQGD
jgi:hypothetical protein